MTFLVHHDDKENYYHENFKDSFTFLFLCSYFILQ